MDKLAVRIFPGCESGGVLVLSLLIANARWVCRTQDRTRAARACSACGAISALRCSVFSWSAR